MKATHHFWSLLNSRFKICLQHTHAEPQSPALADYLPTPSTTSTEPFSQIKLIYHTPHSSSNLQLWSPTVPTLSQTLILAASFFISIKIMINVLSVSAVQTISSFWVTKYPMWKTSMCQILLGYAIYMHVLILSW